MAAPRHFKIVNLKNGMKYAVINDIEDYGLIFAKRNGGDGYDLCSNERLYALGSHDGETIYKDMFDATLYEGKRIVIGKSMKNYKIGSKIEGITEYEGDICKIWERK